MQNSKKIFREKVIRMRDGLCEEKRIEKSRIIKDMLLSQNELNKAETIMCYIDFKSEVMTREFIREILKIRKRVVVPTVLKKDDGSDEIKASLIENIDGHLEKGNLGIFEPPKELVKCIDHREIDLVVIPGVAFDLQKHRMGYGKGLFDKFLTDIRDNCTKIGICFDVQLQGNIPCEKHDILMDMIITEKRVI